MSKQTDKHSHGHAHTHAHTAPVRKSEKPQPGESNGVIDESQGTEQPTVPPDGRQPEVQPPHLG